MNTNMSVPSFFALFFVLALTEGCKIEITVPEGGKVVSASHAYDCDSGKICVVEVNDFHFAETFDAHAAELPERRQRGEAALDVMESHLDGRSFFVDERYSIADIALYAYTHVADEGGFDLTSRPNVAAWLARVASQQIGRAHV